MNPPKILAMCYIKFKGNTGLRWNFSVKGVPFVFFYADFGKYTWKVPSCTISTQIENFWLFGK